MHMRPYLLLDAGGTMVFPDFLLLGQLVREAAGVDHRLESLYSAFLHACHALDQRLGQALQGGSAQPAADDFIYCEMLRRLGLAGADLEKVLEKLQALQPTRHLWTYRFAWLLPTLRCLREQGYRLSVISNSDGRVAEVLRLVGVADFFEIIVDSGREGVAKPDPELFWRALRRLQLTPEAALYIGDFYHIDVLGANRAGIPAVLLDTLGLAEAAGWTARRLPNLSHLPAYLQSADFHLDDPLLFPFQRTDDALATLER
ncbi:MAG: HAD family hydrolase [Limnochordaceae bacterium]|nr:HAD family hydrolase [Limnochordaceae bacterium]